MVRYWPLKPRDERSIRSGGTKGNDMKPYSGNSKFYDTCMCDSCKRGRKVNKPLSMGMKKEARRAGKKEIKDQLNEEGSSTYVEKIEVNL